MSLLSRVEGVFEGIFEGGVRRLFRPQLQPVEIASALERVMAASKVVGPTSLDVANTYRARLNPSDFQRLASLQATIERDTAAHIERRARELGFRPIGPVRVALESDPATAMSFVRADASFDEATHLAIVGAVDKTRRLEILPTPDERTGIDLIAEDGRQLHVADRPIKIGRATDNDFVFRDVRVSRYHAVIEPSANGWVVRDLESTNGTYVDGQRIAEAEIEAPVEISLGGCRLVPRR